MTLNDDGPHERKTDLFPSSRLLRQSEVLMRYYGCGLVLPEQLEGTRILDLGSGAGRDVYALSALVGEKGEVVGVDMTEEQLKVADQYRDYHADVFGFNAPNVSFKKGFIEQLDQLTMKSYMASAFQAPCIGMILLIYLSNVALKTLA